MTMARGKDSFPETALIVISKGCWRGKVGWTEKQEGSNFTTS